MESRHLRIGRRRIWMLSGACLLVLGPIGYFLGGWIPLTALTVSLLAATTVAHWKAAAWLGPAIARGQRESRRDVATFCVVIAVSGYAQPPARPAPTAEELTALRLEAYRAAAHDDLAEDLRGLAADALAAADTAHTEDTPVAWRAARASAERLAHAAQEGNPYVRQLLIQWVEGNPAADR
ncbi:MULTISPECIES: hypothetical protein [unclassified Streptomyces]|uniref:hypothetical protein n=1 Tax=unclassified Streptomyces TaxID=2593676 RepID=UPI000BB16103|nr:MULTISPECIES: hypothetical protein [unclassified Streptomyces]